jgi:NF-X1-type zinc finger protein NFXL1
LNFQIWCCSNCYCFYHLLCIQKWANDSLFQKKQYAENQPSGYYNNLGEFVTKKKIEIVWDCPQCRTTFLPSEIPRHYECFCKKSINPPDHLWQLPHSCGEFCEKKLGSCGHQCNLYCHPGACPPCPQMIRKSCKCGKSPAKLIRCSKQEWTCDRVCLKKLGCEIHSCQEICHDSCKPCTKSSKRKCLCGASTKEIRCSEGSWNCPKKCGKPFACGLHSCERKCHSPSDTCGNCPFSFKSCGCGKTEGFQDCTKDQLDSCGDTCQKPLNCGVHQCLERCHKGACPSCLELIEKSCKCGKIKKEILCSKPLICETKCKNMRACRKHPCSRKCCDGNCPPCDKICGKFLSCGKHKCNALCHDGACYPCPLKVQLKCSCGGTSISVICGREKKTKLPKCRLPCKIPSKCHHTNPHRCHEGVCSRCVQICNLPNDISRCGHLCQAQCHDYVKVVTKDKNFVPAGPWDVPVEKVEWKRIDHPLCEVPVEVTCIGGHETSPLPCHSAKSLSCGRKCQRKLNCENHVCQLECHSVVDRDSDLQDENCQDCQEVCTAKRPPGCLHLCSKNYCHPAPCKKCIVQLKSKCFCGLTDVYYRCCDLNKNGLGEEEKKKIMEKMFSCGNRCIKNVSILTSLF